jgi:hypothetical protein
VRLIADTSKLGFCYPRLMTGSISMNWRRLIIGALILWAVVVAILVALALN